MQIVKDFFASMLAILVFLTTVSLAQPASTKLEIGKPAEFTLKGGETHTFALPISAGQFVEMAIDQRGINVVAVLIAPDGAVASQVDLQSGKRGVEPLFYVSSKVGSIASRSGIFNPRPRRVSTR